MLNPLANGKIQGLFKAFESFQGKVDLKKIRTYMIQIPDIKFQPNLISGSGEKSECQFSSDHLGLSDINLTEGSYRQV